MQRGLCFVRPRVKPDGADKVPLHLLLKAPAQEVLPAGDVAGRDPVLYLLPIAGSETMDVQTRWSRGRLTSTGLGHREVEKATGAVGGREACELLNSQAHLLPSLRQQRPGLRHATLRRPKHPQRHAVPGIGAAAKSGSATHPHTREWTTTTALMSLLRTRLTLQRASAMQPTRDRFEK